MKLLTYLVNSKNYVGIYTKRENTEREVVIDIAAAVELFAKLRNRVYWRSEWSGPWGVLTPPKDMIDIIKYGKKAVIALEDLEKTFWHFARAVDGAWAETALREPDQIKWLSPIPEPPLYIFLSGNTQMMSHQMNASQIPPWPIPAGRLRPVTAIVGNGEALLCDEYGYVKSDMELGVVIGPEVLPGCADNYMDYVFGYTICNDVRTNYYTNRYKNCEGGARNGCAGVATCNKASDGCGPLGPVIATADEVGSPHDLLGYSYYNGVLRAIGHTGAYYYNVRDIVKNYGHTMTLKPGTIIGMGACGYDGYGIYKEFESADENVASVEFQRIGRLDHPINFGYRREEKPKSRYLEYRKAIGLGGVEKYDISNEDIPSITHSFWAMYDNVGKEKRYKVPEPYLYPKTSLKMAEAEIDLLPNLRRLVISCELAGIVGAEPLFNVSEDQVLNKLLGYSVLVSISDMSSVDNFPGVFTPAIKRFATYETRFWDGCTRMGDIKIINGNNGMSAGKITINIDKFYAEGDLSDYGCSLEKGISWITEGITLLPGDVISLGQSSAVFEIPADYEIPKGSILNAEIEGIGSVTMRINDNRDLNAESWPYPITLPTY